MSFLFGAFAAPLRDAPRPLLRVKQDTPRDLGVDGNERASQKPFDGNPYTRLAGADQAALLIWDIDVFVSRRAEAINLRVDAARP